jgi:hypothetical protein
VSEPSVGGDRPLNNVELQLLTERMGRVAENVYWLFFRAGMGSEVHAFIEFCGVLNKYVQICRRCALDGIDFTQFNTHTGQALPVEVHDMEYLGEKLRCIFGPIIDANPEARAALKKALFGSEVDVGLIWDATKEEGAAQ